MLRLLGMGLLLLLSTPGSPAAGKLMVAGDRLEFRIPDLTGDMVAADDPRFAGKVVLVDIWGTWCPPCLSSIPVFARLQEQYGNDGLVVVGIAFERHGDEERAEHLRRFIRDKGINYLVLDGGSPGEVMEKLPTLTGFKGFPVEILIDRNGQVVSSRNATGYSKRWEKRLEAEVLEYLGEKATP